MLLFLVLRAAGAAAAAGRGALAFYEAVYAQRPAAGDTGGAGAAGPVPGADRDDGRRHGDGAGRWLAGANYVAVQTESICYLPAYGIATAATALVGQSIGAGRQDMAKRFAYGTTALGFGLVTVMGGTCCSGWRRSYRGC